MKTIKEQYKEIVCGWNEERTDNVANRCTEIAEEFSIEFLIWASQFALLRFDGDNWQVTGLAEFGFTKTVSTKEILEQFKKEKGL